MCMYFNVTHSSLSYRVHKHVCGDGRLITPTLFAGKFILFCLKQFMYSSCNTKFKMKKRKCIILDYSCVPILIW